MAVQERKIVISGDNKYVAFSELEKGAYLIRVYFTAITNQQHPYINYLWNPDRKFLGRVAFAHGVFVVEEKLIHFNNELLMERRADALLGNHHNQCRYVDVQTVGIEAYAGQPQSAIQALALEKGGGLPVIAQLITGLLALLKTGDGGVSGRIALLDLLGGKAARPPASLYDGPYKVIKPRVAPGHVVDGFYYAMDDGASGEVTIRCFYFDDECPIGGSTGLPSSSAENPPPPSSAAGPDVPGGPGTTPPSTGDSVPPEPGLPAPPSSEVPNPAPPPTKPGQGPEGTVPGVLYFVRQSYTIDGRQVSVVSTVPGRVGGWVTEVVGTVGGRRSYWTYGEGTSSPPVQVPGPSWNVSGFPNQIPSGFSLQVLGRVPNQ